MNKKSKKYFTCLVAVTIIFLVGCGSVQRTTTTKYDAQGNVIEKTEIVCDSSDLTAFVKSADGKATNLYGDITKFAIGTNGINWLSITGGRNTAPAKPVDANLATHEFTDVVKASKISVKTDNLELNK